MAYGELKVDTITFTNGGTDTSVAVSGLVLNPTFSGDITSTGTISGEIILGGTTVSGATVSGGDGIFVSGVFTDQVSGATITGNTVKATSITGVNIIGTTSVSSATIVGTTTVSGATVTGTAGNFTNITGGASTFTSNVTLNGQSDLRFADADSSNYVAFQAPGTVASNVTWTLPNTDATVSGYALVSDGAGNLSWASAGGSGGDPGTVTGDLSVSGSGFFASGISVTGTVSGQTITGTSVQAINITGQTIVGTTTVSGATVTGTAGNFTNITGGASTFTSNVTLNAQSDLRFADSDSSNWVAFQAPAAVGSNITWTLPDTDATVSGYALVSDAAGNLSWASAGGGGSTLSGQTDSATPFETSLGFEAGLNNTGIYNTFIGYQAGKANTTGSYNTAFGSLALDANTTASYNVAIGYQAGSASITNSNNVFIGTQAGLTTTANFCTYIGHQAGYSQTTGGFSTFLGNKAGASQTTGEQNTFLGLNAGFANTTGQLNTFVGQYCGDTNTTGQGNVAVGFNALTANTTGQGNTAVGTAAGISITRGLFNTSLGYIAGDLLTTGNFNTSLGANARPSTSTATGQFTLGDTNVTNLRCNDTTISSLSDIRDKTNVKNLPFGLDFINKLRPVQFDWAARDGSRKGKKDFGFIAQELDEVETHFNTQPYTRLVHKENPEMWEADPMKTYPILIKAVQELSARLEKLEGTL